MIGVGDEVKRLARALHAVGTSKAADGVHDVRTSCRRLDVFLRLSGLRVFRDDLRWLSKSLGELRDVEVALELEFEGASGFREWLQLRRRPLLEDARRIVKSARVTALLRGLRQLPSRSEGAAAPRARALERIAKRGASAAKTEGTLEAFHAERRFVRRARYAREWLGLESARLRARQELLGAVCDLGCLRRQFERAGQPEAVALLSRAIEVSCQQLSR
jgi:CHAD domain-containing protein